MNLNDFIDSLREIFEDTDPEEIVADTNFMDLDDWDSITALSIIALAKSNFGKDITAREIRACDTIQSLFDLIESK